MASSYKHLEDHLGDFTFESIENMGDAHEACRDCFRIIKNQRAAIARQHKALLKVSNELCRLRNERNK